MKILIKALQEGLLEAQSVSSNPSTEIHFPASTFGFALNGLKYIKIFIVVIIYVPPIKEYENLNGACVICESAKWAEKKEKKQK